MVVMSLESARSISICGGIVASKRRRTALAVFAITATAGLAISGIPSTNAALPTATHQSGALTSPFAHTTSKERAVNYDSRTGSIAQQDAGAAAIVAKRGPA